MTKPANFPECHTPQEDDANARGKAITKGIGMNQHTPGPWTIREDRDFTPGGSLTIEWSNIDHAVVIAEVWTANDKWAGPSTQEPVSVANARLIAKAPKMYEFLLRFAHLKTEDGLDPDVDNARALLREIKGEPA